MIAAYVVVAALVMGGFVAYHWDSHERTTLHNSDAVFLGLFYAAAWPVSLLATASFYIVRSFK